MRAAPALLMLACVPGVLRAQKKAAPACVFDTAARRDTTAIVFSVRVRRSDDTATIQRATEALAAVLRIHFHQPASSSALFPIRNWLPGSPVGSEPQVDDGIWSMAFEFVVGPDTYLRNIKVLRASRDSGTDAAFITAIWEADRVADRGVFSSVLERGDSTGIVEFREGPGVAAVMLRIPRIRLDAEVTPRKFAQLKRPKGEPGPGQVILGYTVNERGTVDPESMHVIRATNPRFAAAASETLLKSTFRPARAGGCPVKERVEQQVVFGWEQ